MSTHQWTPDALYDTTGRRTRAAHKRLGFGSGLLPRLLVACGHELALVTVPLGYGPPDALYTLETAETARRTVKAMLGRKTPYWAKLERGRRGLLHVHVMTSLRRGRALPAGTRRKTVTKPLGLVEYLSKPSDARACKQKGKGRRWYPPDPASLEGAIETYEAARSRGRLPRLSWSNSLPRM